MAQITWEPEPDQIYVVELVQAHDRMLTFEKRKEIKAWLEGEEFAGTFHGHSKINHWTTETISILHFSDEKTAAMFKLFWA